MFSDLTEHLNFGYIFLISLLFLAGIYAAPAVVERDIRWLLRYPRWVAGKLEYFFKLKKGFFGTFVIILVLNNISLFSGFLSGFLVVLPLIFAFLTGLHISVIGYDMMGWKGIWHMLVNPVAWLEFPAAWLSLSLGLRLGLAVVTPEASPTALFGQLLPLYFKYVFSLLLLAALIETIMIILAEKFKDEV